MHLTKLIRRSFFFGSKKGNEKKVVKQDKQISKDPLTNLIEFAKQDTLATRKALPPKKDDKLTVFLELEGVLLHSYIPHFTEGYLNQPKRPYDFYFEMQTDEQLFVNVYMRENYKRFLDYLKENTETILFTYNNQIFMDHLINAIGQEQFDFIEHRFYQDDCSLLEKEDEDLCELFKTIDGFGRDLNRSIIIDHRPLSFIAHPNNGVLINEFDGGWEAEEDKNDLNELRDTIMHLGKLSSVQEILKNQYKLEEFLRELNII